MLVSKYQYVRHENILLPLHNNDDVKKDVNWRDKTKGDKR